MVPVARKSFTTLVATALALACDEPGIAREPQPKETGEIMPLPSVTTGAVSLDDALRRRRSVRTFSTRALSPEHIGQLCWAAQGITEPAHGLRATPSAGALYPLELHVVMPSGVFHYEPRGHRLKRADDVDRRAALARAALGQDAVRLAGVDIVITAVVSRTRAKYGARAERYVSIEVGHAAQNVLLEATALGLGAVPIGALDEDAVRRAIGASAEETPLYILAVGHPAE
jgi:SagB-type dehydrogenase family enzyme